VARRVATGRGVTGGQRYRAEGSGGTTFPFDR
jgi:hypothetical protein